MHCANVSSDVSVYTIEYRLLAAVWWYDSNQDRSAMINVRKKLRDRFDTEPPEHRVIKEWSKKLFETGTIMDKPRCGRPNERGQNIDNIRDIITNNPRTSTRRLSEEVNVPRTTVRRVLKTDLHLRPFKPTKVQYLYPHDLLTRVHCCQLILQKYDNNRLRDKIFFSDECAIYLSSKGSNVVIWSNENPHYWEQVQQNPPHVMVWAAMSASQLLGPYFIEGVMDSERYVQLLREQFMPDLQQRGHLYSCHLQQDGAPPHTAVRTREFLNAQFNGRWIGKFGPTPWPPRSPDLTSCDNALWGIVKSNIRQRNPESVDDLKTAVITVFQEIDAHLLLKIHERTFRRFHLCIAKGGVQVDPFDV